MRSMTSSTGQPVVIEKIGPLSSVLLNRPNKLNSLNLEMVRHLAPIYDQWLEEGNETSCVLMKGAGSKAFCAVTIHDVTCVKA